MKPSEYLKSKRWIRNKSHTFNRAGEVTGCCMGVAIEMTHKERYREFSKAMEKRYNTWISTFNDYSCKNKKEAIRTLQVLESDIGL